MNDIILKLPDFEGGFITKSIEGKRIITKNNEGLIIDVREINKIKKGVRCKFGKIINYSDSKVVLQKGLSTRILNKKAINSELLKSHAHNFEISRRTTDYSKLLGEYETPIGIVAIKESDLNEISKSNIGAMDIKTLLTNPDHIKIDKNKFVFKSTQGNGINKTLYIEVNRNNIKEQSIISKITNRLHKSLKGKEYLNIITCYVITNNVNKLKLFKSNAISFKPTGTGGINSGWGKGAERPGHKYIERKPHPSGKGYIYLYELPNGKKKWSDENGNEVKNSAPEKEKIEKFKVGDEIKRGNEKGIIKKISDNFLAIDFNGNIEVVNKKEHLDKVETHKKFKEGEKINYEGEEVEILRKTDNVALIIDKNKNLKVIKLEKDYEKSDIG